MTKVEGNVGVAREYGYGLKLVVVHGWHADMPGTPLLSIELLGTVHVHSLLLPLTLPGPNTDILVIP